MFSRRTLLSLAAGSIAAAPRLASAQQASGKVALYANVGADLTHYDVDVASAELIKRETVTLPAGVQYAWPADPKDRVRASATASRSLVARVYPKILSAAPSPTPIEVCVESRCIETLSICRVQQ